MKYYIMFWIILGACEILAAQLLDSECAVSQFGRRIGRRQVNLAPWMVSLHNGKDFLCAGSLISKAFVLTAAHCVLRTHQQLWARLGERNLNMPKDCLVPVKCDNVYKVKFIYTHPQYKSYQSYDIAILKLEQEVCYTEYIRPICLILQNGIEHWQRYLETIKHFSAHGRGATTYSILQEKNLTQIERSICRDRYNFTVETTHICARSPDPDQYVCTGDSGGPLGLMVTINRFYYYVQLGIVSNGIPDQDVAVFTNVLSYANWIAEVITYDRKYMSPFLAKKNFLVRNK